MEPEAEELVQSGIAGGWPQMAVQVGGNIIPVEQLAPMEWIEQRELKAPGDVATDQGTVLEVDFELVVEVAQLGLEGLALLPVVGKAEGLGLVVEWLFGEELPAAVNLPAQNQCFLI